MTKRNPEITTIKSAFNDLLKSYGLESKFTSARIRKDWAKLMGKPIASRTSKIRVNRGKITVYLTSGPLKQEMNMSKSRVLEMLRKEYGEEEIREIIFL